MGSPNKRSFNNERRMSYGDVAQNISDAISDLIDKARESVGK